MEMDGENGILGILRDEPTRQSRPRFCLLNYGCGHRCRQAIQNVGHIRYRCLALINVELVCGHTIENETYCYERPTILMCQACGCPRGVHKISILGNGSHNHNDSDKVKIRKPTAAPVPKPRLEMSDSSDGDEEEDVPMEIGIETDILGPEENIQFEQLQILQPLISGQQEAPITESVENMDMTVAVEQRKRRYENASVGVSGSGGNGDYEPPFKKSGGI